MDQEQRLKAATVVELLVKNSLNKVGGVLPLASTVVKYRAVLILQQELLVQRGILRLLVGCLNVGENESAGGMQRSNLMRVALVSLFDLVYQSEELKIRLGELKAIVPIIHLLQNSPTKDVRYWALVVHHQLTTCESLHTELFDSGCIAPLVQLTMQSQGGHNLQKLCVHSLVLLGAGKEPRGLDLLRHVVDSGLVNSIVINLKADDPELVYWSLGLIHELALKEIGKDKIRKAPQILKCLKNVLKSSEAHTQKIVLRTLGFLATQAPEFKDRLPDSGICQRLIVCLTSGDLELAHWAIVLLHDIAMIGKDACHVILETPEFIKCCTILIQREANRAESHEDAEVSVKFAMSRLVAETFGFMCASDALHLILADGGIINAIQFFTLSEDPELNFWAAALLLNLISTTPSISHDVEDHELVPPLVEVALKTDREEVVIGCTNRVLTISAFQVLRLIAKALVLLGIESPSIDRSVQELMLMPMIERVAASAAGLTSGVEIGVVTLLLRGDRHKVTNQIAI